MPDDLCLLPAVELARRIRERELSARELLSATLARIDEVDGTLNAMVTRDDERALATAAALDEAIVHNGPVGPLHGLPVAHKDLLATAGLRTTFGSRIYADFMPTADAPLAARVRAAGGVRVGKTNVPELGAGSQTSNPVFGTTRNPYDPSRTCGGSSGGAAVALATGMAALADGSDMGGSLRNPASFCNVVGLRPTPGLVADQGLGDRRADQGVLGPMGRTVADAALLLGVIAQQQIGPLDRDLRGVRCAWGGSLGLPYQREVLTAYEQARPGAQSLGVVLEEAEPDLAGADEVFRVLRGHSMATGIGNAVDRAGDRVGPLVRENVAYGRTVTEDRLHAAMDRRAALRAAAAQFFTRYDYLLLPVSQVLPFDAGVPWVREIDGEQLPDYLGWMRSAYLVSVLGVPAASVPAGFTPDGLPVGLQVVGRAGDDLGVLQVGHALEQVYGATVRRPDLAALRTAR